ncbi:MAG: universal stress protein [Candidatus Obscuribacterales bacterium]|nr:universal stress protein [Candidatus Obscuribacterales bacterium]
MNILIALSDRYFGDAIVDFMRSRKWPAETRVLVMCVVEPVDATPDWKDKFVARQVKLLEDIVYELKLHNPELSVEKALTSGKASSSILSQAKEANADLIVMGSHGRKGLERLLLGSVALAVTAKADCSVAIVKPSQLSYLDVSITEEDMPQSVCEINTGEALPAESK